jgi:predicted PurR-regulated permease PerM
MSTEERPPPAGHTLFSRPVAIGFTVVLLAGAAYALVVVRVVLLVGFLGILVGAVLTYPINALSRLMPRGVAVLVTLVLLLGLLTGLGWLAAPFVSEQVDQLGSSIPAALANLEKWWARGARAATGTSMRRSTPRSRSRRSARG